MTIDFRPDGMIRSLYDEQFVTKLIEGRLYISRASNIEWDDEQQLWKVIRTRDCHVLFSHQSRQKCLEWEKTNDSELL